MAVWGGLRNSCEQKRRQKQRRKGRYKHLNAEFQKISRRDKKAFFSDQCREIDENNRMEDEMSSRELEIPRKRFVQRWAR